MGIGELPARMVQDQGSVVGVQGRASGRVGARASGRGGEASWA
jgi:hypothetical protein